ncbi:MAG: hypothetical protein D6771_04665 [Zetaproteobacteria bacterium]|nr:MAG: hypothetical protein D6771_04665 [Zetaproteobacteria bacterium]
MSNQRLLSPEEIAALTEAFGEDETAEAIWAMLPPIPEPEDAKPFAFSEAPALDPKSYPVFGNLHWRLAEMLRDRFGELFGREVAVEVQDAYVRPCREWLQHDRPRLWFVYEEAAVGRMAAAMDLPLVLACVDAMLAGPGEIEGEVDHLTEVELKLSKHLGLRLIREIAEIWQPVATLHLSLQRMATETEFLQVAPPNTPCFIVDVEIQAGAQAQGVLSLCYPKEFLDPFLERLKEGASEDEPADAAWAEMLERSLAALPAQVSLELARLSLSVGRFLRLKPGDEIPLGVLARDPAWLAVRGRRLRPARPAERDGLLVAEVLDMDNTQGGSP